MRHVLHMFVVVVTVYALTAPSAGAQDERVRVSGTVSAAVGDGGPALALGVAGGFQLAPHAGLEIELLYIPDQDLDVNDLVFPAIFPIPRFDFSARTVAFVSSFVTALEVGRVRPYAQFGGGIANVERQVTVDYSTLPLLGSSFAYSSFSDLASGTVSSAIIRPFPYATRVSENDLVLTAGAGLDIRVWKRLSVAADVRYLHLFGSADGYGLGELQHITRIGARASWWF